MRKWKKDVENVEKQCETLEIQQIIVPQKMGTRPFRSVRATGMRNVKCVWICLGLGGSRAQADPVDLTLKGHSKDTHRAPGIYRAPIGNPIYGGAIYGCPIYRAHIYNVPIKVPIYKAPMYTAPIHRATVYRDPI